MSIQWLAPLAGCAEILNVLLWVSITFRQESLTTPKASCWAREEQVVAVRVVNGLASRSRGMHACRNTSSCATHMAARGTSHGYFRTMAHHMMLGFNM